MQAFPAFGGRMINRRTLAKSLGAAMAISATTTVPATAEADGVRQHGERSNDGGKTWVTEFDLRYKRVRLQPDATSSAPS